MQHGGRGGAGAQADRPKRGTRSGVQREGMLGRARCRHPGLVQWRGQDLLLGGEAVAPKASGRCHVPRAEPFDVAGIWRGGRQAQAAAGLGGLQSREEFLLQDAQAPAIHQDVVMGKYHLYCAVAKGETGDARGRRLGEAETSKPIGLLPSGKAGLLGLRRQRREILKAQPRRGLFQHGLKRAVAGFMQEDGAQDVVPVVERFPDLDEGGTDGGWAHAEAELLDIGRAIRVTQRVEQHALLHGGERIECLQILAVQHQLGSVPLSSSRQARRLAPRAPGPRAGYQARQPPLC